MNCDTGKQLVEFKFMRMHRSCQWDDRSAFLVPGHCFAHVKGILLPTVVSQHPPVHYVAKLQAAKVYIVSAVFRRKQESTALPGIEVLLQHTHEQPIAVFVNQCTGHHGHTFLQQEDAWPGQSPNKQVHQSSCQLPLVKQPHVLVHVDCIGIRRSYKEIHKVAIMHFSCGVLQDLHELLCQPLPPAQATCKL